MPVALLERASGMRNYVLLIILSLPSTLHAQSFIDSALQSHPLMPHPYVFAGPVLMPGGYASLAGEAGAGLRIDSEHLLLDAHALYDNGHKAKDNTGPNPKGHDRSVDGSLRYRFASGWAFGGGASWSQLSTTNYTKSAWHPRFGGSRDFFVKNCMAEDCRGEFTMRVEADYFLRGSDRSNGTQGVMLNLYIPSPSLARHLFFREKIAMYRYHDTITTTDDPVVLRREMSNHFDSYVEFTVMYRF